MPTLVYSSPEELHQLSQRQRSTIDAKLAGTTTAELADGSRRYALADPVVQDALGSRAKSVLGGDRWLTSSEIARATGGTAPDVDQRLLGLLGIKPVGKDMLGDRVYDRAALDHFGDGQRSIGASASAPLAIGSGSAWTTEPRSAATHAHHGAEMKLASRGSVAPEVARPVAASSLRHGPATQVGAAQVDVEEIDRRLFLEESRARLRSDLPPSMHSARGAISAGQTAPMIAFDALASPVIRTNHGTKVSATARTLAMAWKQPAVARRLAVGGGIIAIPVMAALAVNAGTGSLTPVGHKLADEAAIGVGTLAAAKVMQKFAPGNRVALGATIGTGIATGLAALLAPAAS
ncbi:MAG: hypothetical protein H7287_05065 [Thermoleophilia bacterium]|nr:hypothetical protein [Thermoleophilia bacterium]